MLSQCVVKVKAQIRELIKLNGVLPCIKGVLDEAQVKGKEIRVDYVITVQAFPTNQKMKYKRYTAK